MRIRTKRIYKPADPSDGHRILVDRLWPRGITKEKAVVDYWARDVAPSDDLRRWYAHDPSRWNGFRRRYRAELQRNRAAIAELRRHLNGRTVTLLFSSKEPELNNATALLEYLQDATAGP